MIALSECNCSMKLSSRKTNKKVAVNLHDCPLTLYCTTTSTRPGVQVHDIVLYSHDILLNARGPEAVCTCSAPESRVHVQCHCTRLW